MPKILMVGLDYSGKTSLIKKFQKLDAGEAEFYMTTPYINIEKVRLPRCQKECIMIDMSGQVSARKVP